MRRVVLPAILVGLVIAIGCSNSAPCPCPASPTGPGWCPATIVEGDGNTCTCNTTTLCPGWCQPGGPSSQPVPCATDGGSSAGSDAGSEAGSDAGSEAGSD
jgi:hypothetical protein